MKLAQPGWRVMPPQRAPSSGFIHQEHRNWKRYLGGGDCLFMLHCAKTPELCRPSQEDDGLPMPHHPAGEYKRQIRPGVPCCSWRIKGFICFLPREAIMQKFQRTGIFVPFVSRIILECCPEAIWHAFATSRAVGTDRCLSWHHPSVVDEFEERTRFVLRKVRRDTPKQRKRAFVLPRPHRFVHRTGSHGADRDRHRPNRKTLRGQVDSRHHLVFSRLLVPRTAIAFT